MIEFTAKRFDELIRKKVECSLRAEKKEVADEFLKEARNQLLEWSDMPPGMYNMWLERIETNRKVRGLGEDPVILRKQLANYENFKKEATGTVANFYEGLIKSFKDLPELPKDPNTESLRNYAANITEKINSLQSYITKMYKSTLEKLE